MLYPALKSLHLLALISWMAGLFYLPRLFVYHAEGGLSSPQAETFRIMERRLLKAIMLPAMIATWVFGLALAQVLGAWGEGWLQAKMALVLALSGLHGYLSATARRFAAGGPVRSGRFYRVLNEVPTVLLIGIVGLVVFKPF